MDADRKHITPTTYERPSAEGWRTALRDFVLAVAGALFVIGCWTAGTAWWLGVG